MECLLLARLAAACQRRRIYDGRTPSSTPLYRPHLSALGRPADPSPRRPSNPYTTRIQGQYGGVRHGRLDRSGRPCRFWPRPTDRDSEGAMKKIGFTVLGMTLLLAGTSMAAGT